MDLKLTGKSVLITGGSRGIGYASAQLFAEEGCRVTVLGGDRASVDAAEQRLKATYGTAIDAVCLDLGQSESLGRLKDRLEMTDILVNNAGAIPGGGLETLDDAQWRSAWDLKVYGYINAIRKALPAMMERGYGVVVNVIGIAGAAPRYDYLCGSTANAALISFTKAVGAHGTTRGVRVVGVNPGPTETDRLITLYKSRAEQRFGDEARWPEMLSHLPFGRAAKPEEIADLIVFLSSVRASYLSGVVIDADGGAMYGNS
jgi:3-oxoacyl-[acyl-carrier protein] reductase